jgi:2-polyprenyl-6-hydroxyphenyl methylase/3-demethylubiquinone-9 3-methyltransferase
LCASLRHMTSPRASEEELRRLYGSDYVGRYHLEAGRRLERLVERMDLAPEMTVADLGCGNGLLLDVIAHRVGHYFGVDFSDEFIAEARSRHANQSACRVDFACQSIEEFCTQHRGGIDRAFSLDVVEHVYDEQLLPILKSIRSCLKPQGRLYVHTPNGEFLLERLKEWGVLKQLPEHIAVRDARNNVELLKQAGFSRVELKFLPHYLWQLSWLHAFSPLPGIGKYLRARLLIECHY